MKITNDGGKFVQTCICTRTCDLDCEMLHKYMWLSFLSSVTDGSKFPMYVHSAEREREREREKNASSTTEYQTILLSFGLLFDEKLLRIILLSCLNYDDHAVASLSNYF